MTLKTITMETQSLNILMEYLIKSGTCSDDFEANIIAEQILEEAGVLGVQIITDVEIKLIADMLDQYIGFDSKEYALACAETLFRKNEDDNSVDDISEDIDNVDVEADENNHDEYLGDGECELCERNMRLTRHHLIPKSTWSKLKKRLLHASTSLDSEKSKELFDSFVNFPSNITAKSISMFLQRTCNVCRPCHSHLHRLHGELELAIHFNTADKLLEDDDMCKFCKWSNKQRVGAGSSRGRSGNLRYNR